jgi:uncharacterized membrane protein
MVKSLTAEERTALQDAINKAEQSAAATIRVVIHPASDRYAEFVLLYGLILSSFAAMILWATAMLNSLPWFLAVQFGFMLMIDLVPWLRHIAQHLVSSRIQRHRAARLAFEEYHAHHTNLTPGQDFVLLYVSLIEHYVHVITNPIVHGKLPNGWDVVTDHFTDNMRRKGLGIASIQAVEQIGTMLSKS